MLSDFDREVINGVLEDIFNSNFTEAYFNDEVHKWTCNNASYNGYYFCTDGATKYVIILDDVDYVLKLSRRSMSKDYCAIEAHNYVNAINHGLEWAFAETFYFNTINGIDFFAQRKFRCDEYGVEDEFYSYARSTYPPEEYDEEENEDEFNECLWDTVQEFDIWDALRAVYGECEETNALASFCNEYKINDLHAQNFGHGDYGEVYIIDFSGYSE